MPIPQVKIALGIVLALIITIAYSYCMVNEIEVSEGALAVMVGMVVGTFTVGAHEYKTKRTTDLDYIKEVGNANAGSGK